MIAKPYIPPKKPWWVGDAIDYLDSLLRPEFIAFEWGAGGSTLWLAKRVSFVTSMEHEAVWYDGVISDLDHFEVNNVNPVYIAMEAGDYDYDNYARYILRYKPYAFDVISVDGRNRVQCLKYAIPKLRPGGIMVLDDAQRAHYQSGIDLMSDWERHDFTDKRATTTVWIRPLEN